MDFSFSPQWIKDPPPIEDEVIPGRWGYHALQMANKFYAPPRLAYVRGPVGDDQRIKYMAYFLDVREQRVLEIGPYECHHSIILEKMGVAELVAVEAREENINKCSRIKDKYQLNRTTIVRQDIEDIFNGKEPAKFTGPFDLVFCCGVLYHIPDPAQALQWFHTLAPKLFLATHYFEPGSAHSYAARGMNPGTLHHSGKAFEGVLFNEGGIKDQTSGMSPVSFWPREEGLLEMLSDAGYQNVSVLGKDMHNNFPHITILAS